MNELDDATATDRVRPGPHVVMSSPDASTELARPSRQMTARVKPNATTGRTRKNVAAMTPPSVLPQESADGLGAVFTRRWAAELVLDIGGYKPGLDLSQSRVTEPSCGTGAFLVPIVERLAQSCDLHGRDLADTTDAIRAYDLDRNSVEAARTNVAATLSKHGLAARDAKRLARAWVSHRDFLLQDCEPTDWIIGNPPYVRLEEVPTDRSAAYRARWDTMQGRADVYVGFIQAGLESLEPEGSLSFICADRWMRNQYGKRLRRMIEAHYAVDTLFTLHDSDVFENRVAAYPAIFNIRNATQGVTLNVDADATFNSEGAAIVSALHTTRATNNLQPKAPLSTSQTPPATVTFSSESTGTPISTDSPAVIAGPGFTATWTHRALAGSPSWPTGAAHRLALVDALEAAHTELTDPQHGIRIGIGIASGADSIFLTKKDGVVEPERLMPVVMTGDLKDGAVDWSGTLLINPWGPDGTLLDKTDLSHYPQLGRYYSRHKKVLSSRHVGKRQPDRWYRTIDKPVDGLATSPKLLMPDLRHRVVPVLEQGLYYPHHNLFWITSHVWDLKVLGGLLLSDFGTLFVETYSPRMAGGALRITSQYLKRIRLPDLTTLNEALKDELASAFDARDICSLNRLAAAAYGVDPQDLAAPG